MFQIPELENPSKVMRPNLPLLSEERTSKPGEDPAHAAVPKTCLDCC